MPEKLRITTAKAVSILLIFPTTYLCEKGLPPISNFKTSKINRLQTKHDLYKLYYVKSSRDGVYCVKIVSQISHRFFFVSLHVIQVKYSQEKCKLLFIQL